MAFSVGARRAFPPAWTAQLGGAKGGGAAASKKVQDAGRGAVDVVSSATRGLPSDAVKVFGVILVLAFLPSIIGAIAGSGGGEF